jgi:cytoskeletal protein RodZ
MRVGSELKAARKKAGITVEVISKRTKIKVSKLVALEKNDFKNLPIGLYLFSTVRAYAREVNVDPEPMVERLRAEFADKDALDALHALDAAGALDGKNRADGKYSGGRSRLFRNAAIAAGVVLMAAAGAYFYNAGRITADGRKASSPPTTTVATAHRPAETEESKPKTTVLATAP